MYDGNYTVVPNYILEDEDLSTNQKMLLITLLSYRNSKSEIAYPSYKQIKKRSSIKTDETIKNTSDLLVEKGYISKKIKVGKGIEYKILPPVKTVVPQKIGARKNELTPAVKTVVPQKVSTHKNEGTPPRKTVVHPPEKQGTTNKNTNTNTKTIYISLKFINEIISFVKLTKQEYEKLKDKYGQDLLHKKILALDDYIANGKGKDYKSHYRTLMTWIEKEPQTKKLEQKPYLMQNNYISEELV
ncbi:MAG: helix-turn-helix domain-containing protein [Clostridium sp.]